LFVGPTWQVHLYFQRDYHFGTGLPTKVSDHFICDPAGIAAYTGGIKKHRTVEAPWPSRWVGFFAR
jgi:hypothetical protein